MTDVRPTAPLIDETPRNNQAPLSVTHLWIRPHGCHPLPCPPPPQNDEPGFAWLDVTDDQDFSWVETAHTLTGCMPLTHHRDDTEWLTRNSAFESTRDYGLIIFRGMTWTAPPSPREALRIVPQPTLFFLFQRCLVSVGAAHAAHRQRLRERLLSSAGAAQRMPEHPEALALRLLNDMVDRYVVVRRPLTDRLDTLQRALLDPRRPFNDWLALLEARRQLRKLENLSEEQLDALQEWRDARLDADSAYALAHAASHAPLSDAPQLEARHHDLVQHIERVRNHARRLEAAAESAVQLHFSATAHRTNQIMRTLTVITAIFMPLNLITGIFGMNFEALPGIHSPSGFWWIVGVMGGLSALLMALFRARRYLEPDREHGLRAPRRPSLRR